MSTVLLLIILSQWFWFLRVWRIAGRIRRVGLRSAVRAVWCGVSGLALIAFFSSISWQGKFLNWHNVGLLTLSALWISSAMFAYLAVTLVYAIAFFIRLFRRLIVNLAKPAERPEAEPENPSPAELPLDPINFPRRRFLQTSSALAGALPFMGAGYGFLIERFNYQIRQVDLPLSGLPPALAGLRIVQLSDIHIGSYMSARGVRRAVDMANELKPDVTFVTGDFITRRGDPLESCISELSRLQAPLGVWGCNGNHEIYAAAEDEAERLFALHGMVLLRQQGVELVHRSQPLNLIGVDYQRQRNPHRMLKAIELLVRHDMPNILLSHNPNTFPRSAELGIELMLTGHTHGGQVKVEILDHRFSPAQFLTPYVAGMYLRPLLSSSDLHDQDAWDAMPNSLSSVVYVNRGLGTIGAPVRLGVPPEISLFTLRRA